MPLTLSSVVSFMIQSITRLKSTVDITQPCRTPAPGGYLTKFNIGRLRPEVQPFKYTILVEKVLLLYTFY